MEAARRVGAYVVALSTDYVFDGEKDDRRTTSGTRRTRMSVYGASKLAGEFEIDPDCAVVRTSWVCGRHGSNMVKTILRLAQQKGTMRFVTDQRGSPTIVSDLVVALRAFVVDRLPGHLARHQPGRAHLVRVRPRRAHGRRRRPRPGRADHDRRDGPAPRPRPVPRTPSSTTAALRLAGRPLLPDYRESVDRLVKRAPRPIAEPA